MPGWPEKKGKSRRRRPEIRLTERVDGVINEMYVRCKNGEPGKCREEQADWRAADKNIK